MMVLIMSKIKKVELSPIYLRKNDDVGATYCSFSEDLLFNVGYEKIKDLTLEIDDEYYAYFPTVENGTTLINLSLPSKFEIKFDLEITNSDGITYIQFTEGRYAFILGKSYPQMVSNWLLNQSLDSFNQLEPLLLNTKYKYNFYWNGTSGNLYSNNNYIKNLNSGEKLTSLLKIVQTEGAELSNIIVYDRTNPQQATIKKNKSRPLKTIIEGEQENKLQGVEVNFVADDDVDISRIRIIATKRVIKSGGKTTFNISVFDENNNPIPNVFVELIDSD